MTNSDGTLAVPAGASGVYSAQGLNSGPGHFPTQSWNASNYWADVIFAPTESAPEPAPSPAPDLGVIYRWNAGTNAVAATDGGPDWVASANTTVGSATIASHGGTWTLANSVPGTTPVGIFAQEYWGSSTRSEMGLEFGNGSLPGGTYAVRLYMGDGYSGTSDLGERVFDVSVEDQLLLDDLDLSGTLGHRVGGMFEWQGAVQDGTVNIDFEHVIENPLINAVEIILLQADM